MVSALLVLSALLLVAYVSYEICRWLKIPKVLGHLSAGLIIGIPAIKALVINGHEPFISALAEIGSVLLFFSVGMEINLHDFSKQVRKVALVPLFNTLLPFILGMLFMRYAGLDWPATLIVSLSLSVSAVALSADFLSEAKLLRSKVAQQVIAAGATDDIFELTLISAVLAIVQTSFSQFTILKLFLNIIIFLLIIAFFKTILVPWLLKLFEREHSNTSLFAGALIITLLIAGLAEVFDVGAFIGALIAGLLVRQILLAQKIPSEEQHLSANVKVIAFGFFVPIFVLWVGMNASQGFGSIDWLFAGIITFIATFGTVLGSAIGIRLTGGSWRDGVTVGFGVNPKGDTELAVAAIALNLGIIGSGIFAAIVFMSITTTFFSPIIFKMLLKAKHFK